MPNPSTLLSVTTTGCSYFPFPGRLPLYCSIILLSVIKVSQEELRCSRTGEELSIGVHIPQRGQLTVEIEAFSWPQGDV